MCYDLTIGLPVYNDVAFLRAALDSLLSQTYTNAKILISDDFSTDGSDLICLEYASLYSNVQYYRQIENIGISRNMEFLLKNCKTEFFMWAANDDEWSCDFVEILMNELRNDVKATVAFGPFVQISETGTIVSDLLIENYYENNTHNRLKKFILKPSDGFGYGLFRTKMIKDVKFPKWVWPNHKCAYNNIYPTLLYYLAQGKYLYVDLRRPIWFNRIKTELNVNHKIPFKNSGFVLCYLAFLVRKLNLVIFSIYVLFRSENLPMLSAIALIPRLFYSWFFIPVFLNPMLKYRAFKEYRYDVFI